MWLFRRFCNFFGRKFETPSQPAAAAEARQLLESRMQFQQNSDRRHCSSFCAFKHIYFIQMMPVDAAQIRLEEKLKLRYRRWGFTVCFSKKDLFHTVTWNVHLKQMLSGPALAAHKNNIFYSTNETFHSGFRSRLRPMWMRLNSRPKLYR